MPNDSTTLGYLTPLSVVPVNDRSLEDIFSEVVVGITGLPQDLVRPRYQPKPGNQPDFEVDWCAMGVAVDEHDVFDYQRHLPYPDDPEVPVDLRNGVNIVERDEYFTVLCSFYGAHNQQYMARWRDGLGLSQNRYALLGHGIKLVAVGRNPVNVPALLKNTWVRRIDLACQFSRRVTVTYGVRSVASAGVTLNTDVPPTQTVINVNQ